LFFNIPYSINNTFGIEIDLSYQNNIMKTLLSTIIAIVFFVGSFAQSSSLTIFSEDGNSFYLILNGIRQNENPETNVRVENLTNDYYSTKVIFSNQSFGFIERKILMVVDADANHGAITYKIKRTKKGTLVLRYFSFTPAAQVVAPPTNVAVVHYNTVPLAAINFGTSVTTTNTSVSTTTGGGTTENVSVNMNLGGINMGANVSVNDGGTQTNITTNTVTTTTTSSSNSYPNNDIVYYQEEEIGCSPMNESSFYAAKQSIEDKSFSDTKLTLAKQIAESNCLKANQIKEICKIFSFEDTRLKFAKFAYQYCFDQNNYWQINDSFDFESSVSELNDYIRSH